MIVTGLAVRFLNETRVDQRDFEMVKLRTSNLITACPATSNRSFQPSGIVRADAVGASSRLATAIVRSDAPEQS